MGFVEKAGGAGSLIGAACMLPLIAWAREGGESPVLDKMVTGLFDAYPHICFAIGDFGNTNIKTRSRQAFNDSVTAFKITAPWPSWRHGDAQSHTRQPRQR